MTRSRSIVRHARRILLLTACCALAACGTDGGGGGQVAGIEGTGIVSGFGSVYVDGIEFATDDATIIVNGNQANEDALRVGDRVAVVGTIDDDGDARAERIVFARTLEGPIDAITTDGENGTLEALGQTVRFDGDTTFVNTPAGELEAGDLIAVSGFFIPSRGVDATSIEQGPMFTPSTTLEIDGRIDAVDGTQFTVGTQTVDFSNARVAPNRDALAPGVFVEALGTRATQAGTPLMADRVDVVDLNTTDEGRRMFVEAEIRDYDSTSAFVAGGWRIDASDAERIGNASTPLAPGVQISVRGRYENDRVKAETLEVEPPPAITLQGQIDAIDRDAQRITLLGRGVALPEDTRYWVADANEPTDRRLRIDNLSTHETVRVYAYADGAEAIARRLERVRDSAAMDAIVAGPLAQVERSGAGAQLVVAGVTAQTIDSTTTYYDAGGQELTAEAFFARATPGTRVKLVGPQNAGGINVVREARLQSALDR